MTSANDLRQEQEWQALHDRVTETLDQFGVKDPFGKGDYWLLDENWGWVRHQGNYRLLVAGSAKH